MQTKLAVHCEKNRLKDIRSFIEQSLQHQKQLDESAIYEMITAVDEVCANMMIHANDCNPEKSIEIEIFIDEKEGVTFKIFDNGIQFDYKAYNEPTIDQIVKDKKKGGLGMMIVKKVMDRIEFLNDHNHNTCILHRSFRK